MGVDFFLVDIETKETFELGRHFYLDIDFKLYCNDEYGFKYCVFLQIKELGLPLDLNYAFLLADALWDFVKHTKKLEIKTDGQLINECFDFGTKFHFLNSRYYLNDPNKHQEHLHYLNNQWGK